jgi:6-pyruvoyltetrahydropterin/6-carboxytetrahydropterin synthase
LVVKGSLHAEYGWVVDYAFMKEVSKPCLDLLDHHYLNDVEGLENPTSEVLARWMFEKLQPRLPGLHQVIIEETCTSECRYPAHP